MPLPIEPWASNVNPREIWRPKVRPPRYRAPRPHAGREPRRSLAGTRLRLTQPWYGPILLILAVAAYLFGGRVPTGLAVLWALVGLVDAVWATLSVAAARVDCHLPGGPFTAGDVIPVEIVVERPAWLAASPLALAATADSGGRRIPGAAAGLPSREAGTKTGAAVAASLAAEGRRALGPGAAPGPAIALRTGAGTGWAATPSHAGASMRPDVSRSWVTAVGADDALLDGADTVSAPRTLVLRTTVRAIRGRHRVAAIQIGASGPFGVAGSLRRIEPASEMLVLPRLHRLPTWPAGRGGQRRGPSSGRPSSDAGAVLGVRPLQEGDPLRRVHWKRSAATATWQVKRLEPEPVRPAAVVLDLAAAAYAGGGPDLADRAVELAAAAAAAQTDAGRSGAVWLHGTGRRPIEARAGAGTPMLRPLLEVLAEAEPDGRLALGEWLRQHLGRILPRGGTLVLVTPQPPAAWIGPLLLARRAGVEAAAVLLVRPGVSRGASVEACGALQQAGISAWAVDGVEDLAAQLALGGGRAPRRRAEA